MSVVMDLFVLLMVAVITRVDLRSVLMVFGEQSVVMCGIM